MLPIYDPASPASSSHVVSFAEPPSSRSRGLTIRFHPAVVWNFFRYHTRLEQYAACNGISCSEGATAAQQLRMFGCVIGVQRGQTVEVVNSLELVLDPVSGTLDPGFLKNMQEQSKKVYPDFDVLGWYSIGSAVQDSDIQIHKAFMGFYKHPVYLLLHPTFELSQKELPVTIYESESRVMDGGVELHFVKSNYIIEIVEVDKIPADFSLSRPASTAESAEQDHLPSSEIGLESNDRDKNKPYSKVLLETPSGFAMFDVSDWVLSDPEEIWIWFTRIDSAKKAVHALGFVKIDKSVARDSGVGPGKDLEEFILTFCNGTQLIVPDLQIKAVIEEKLKVQCFCEKEIVHELMWGLNYALAAFVPEEKGYPINERPLSKYLERKIKTRLVNASLQKIDREFIDMLGFLVHQELASVIIPSFLHNIFNRWIHVTKNMNDEKFAEEVVALLSSPEAPVAEILEDSDHSKEDILKLIEDFSECKENKMYALLYFRRRLEVISTEVDLQEAGTVVDDGSHKETSTEVYCGNDKIEKLGIVGFLKQHWIQLLSFGIIITGVVLASKGEAPSAEKIGRTSLSSDVN